MSVPSIEDLKKIQADESLLDVHVVYLSEARFVIAHTDNERKSGMDLQHCKLHQWLVNSDFPPMLDEEGYYVVDNLDWIMFDRLEIQG